MKKIFFWLSILITFGVITNSCISGKVIEEIITPPEPTPPEPTPPGPVEKKSFNVTTLIEYTTFYKRYQMGNDQIGLFIANDLAIENNIPLTLIAGDGQVEITTAQSNAYCYGYYPYSSAISNTEYSGAVSVKQDQDVSISPNPGDIPKPLTDQLLMIAGHSTNIAFNSQVAILEFKNIFSILNFQIRKDSEFTDFNNQRLKKFEVFISHKSDSLTPLPNYKLAGPYTINFQTATYLGNLTPVFSATYSPKITADVANSPVITTDMALNAWIIIPPLSIAADDNLVFKIETEDDKEIEYTSIHTFGGQGLIARNELKSYPVIITKDNAFSNDLVDESFVDRPANCYIISEPGIYEIAAKKVKGEIINGNSVDWLWASVEGGDIPSAVDINDMFSVMSYDQGIIKFRVGEKSKSLKEGNIILALKDDDDKILWTWHLWITDKPQDVMYENSKIFMDRNIGALSAGFVIPGVDNYGFVYQWGRKDPFFGGNGLVNEASSGLISPIFSVAEDNTVINNTVLWESNAARWGRTNTIYGDSEMAIRYPMLFICNNNSTPYDNPLDWLSPSDPDRWSDIEKKDNDPCPYGYKVPSKSDLSSLFEFESDEITPKYFRYRHYKYWEYSFESNISEWPAAGMRQGRSTKDDNYGAQLLFSGTGSSIGQCFYWTSSSINVDGITISGGSHRVHTTAVFLNENDYGDNADAYPVRCVKMQ